MTSGILRTSNKAAKFPEESCSPQALYFIFLLFLPFSLLSCPLPACTTLNPLCCPLCTPDSSQPVLSPSSHLLLHPFLCLQTSPVSLLFPPLCIPHSANQQSQHFPTAYVLILSVPTICHPFLPPFLWHTSWAPTLYNHLIPPHSICHAAPTTPPPPT